MCFSRIVKNIFAWLFGDFIITKDNYAAFVKEIQQEEEAEAEKKKEAEALQNARFPFLLYPEARCLAADPWREPNEARLESQARIKLAMAQEQEEHPSKADLNEVFDLLRFAFDSVSNRIRVLEDRLELMLGQRIPQLPSNDEAESNWN